MMKDHSVSGRSIVRTILHSLNIAALFRKYVKNLAGPGTVICLFFLLFYQSPLDAHENPYHPYPADHYLTGRFSAREHPSMISLDAEKIPVNRSGHYLRKEAVEALKRMLSDFHKENPNIKIFIISSFRDFSAQKRIWETKWKNFASSHPDPADRADAILKYSSMPGTSRHHWGTDFDINSLENRYFESGEGKIIFDWLEKNAFRYGFCRPYTGGRTKGYLEEKWHWSYQPLASVFLRDWMKFFHDSSVAEQTKKLQNAGLRFQGYEYALHKALEYVSSVSEECK